jgi:molybdopterin/thiamine biosynthesis adenylyltransferase
MADPFERYSRQMILPGWGREGQGRLAKKTAAVVGCGALGSHIASHLVRAGVGRLVLADRDCVEWHNLPRQALFAESMPTRWSLSSRMPTWSWTGPTISRCVIW